MSYTKVFVCAILEDGNEESVSVLPRNWIKGSTAYWSDDKNFKSKHYHDCCDVDPNWPSYRVKKELLTGDFNTCRIYQKGYQTSLESTGEEEVEKSPKKRSPLRGDPSPPQKKSKVASRSQSQRKFSDDQGKRKNYGAHKVDSDDDSSDSESSEREDNRTMNLSTLKNTHLSSQSSPLIHFDGGPFNESPLPKKTVRENESPRRSPRKHVTPNSHKSTFSTSSSGKERKSESRSESKSSRKSLGFGSGTKSSESGKGKHRSKSAACNIQDMYPLPEAEFQRKQINLLLEIKKLVGGPNKDKIYDRTEKKKCETVEELCAYDKKLDDQKEFENLIDLWLSVGGKDTRQNVGRMLRVTTTNAVLSELNHDGNGNKMSFKSLTNLNLALERCCKAKTGADDMVVKTALQDVLKDAPDREGGSRWAKKQQKKQNK
ncbi:uncharacterized protein [Clytia hemisphaerica]|uniref:Uncharacterized protein n=1 Tax=Clytia hemisphaerica TaxID=252671 RepID=A0A7M5U2T2_9CNID